MNNILKDLFKSFPASALLAFFIIFTGCKGTGADDINYDDANWTHLSSKNNDFPVPGRSREQTSIIITDIDKDGIDDFVVGSRRNGSSVKWYKRNGDSWDKYIIDKSTIWIESGGAFHDIDGDGDTDIVFGADGADNKIWWWENPYPDFSKNKQWKRYYVKNSGANKHHDQIFGDFDGDGQEELVFWNQRAGKLMIAEIPEDPKKTEPWTYDAIYTIPEKQRAEGLDKADIDGDGKMDIVGGGNWFKHMGGIEYKANVIDPILSKSRSAVGQFIEGGYPEIILVRGNGPGRIKMYEYVDSKWVAHNLLDYILYDAHTLQLGDINEDGHLDIFTAEMRLGGEKNKSKMLILFGDGKGNFDSKQIASGFGSHESKLSDLDGDGDLDILIKPLTWRAPVLDILINNNKWKRHVIDSDKPWRSIFISSADIDNDGHKDVITGGWWYKNPGLNNGKWERTTIGGSLNNMALVLDIDSDGDTDVLGTMGEGSENAEGFVLARNNGEGLFIESYNIASADGDFLQGVAVDRFKDGGIQVALSWHEKNKAVQLLSVPTDLTNKEWKIETISNDSQDEDLSSGDIDGDGRTDLLLGTKWLRNTGADWETYTIHDTSKNPDRNSLVDINGDTVPDVLVGYEAIGKKGKVAWYERNNPLSRVWKENVVAIVIGPMSLDAGDIDNDGDTDIVVGEHNPMDPGTSRTIVFTNTDGKGKTWLREIVYVGDEHHDGTQLVDIDDDGDLDIISIGWTHPNVVLYENRS